MNLLHGIRKETKCGSYAAISAISLQPDLVYSKYSRTHKIVPKLFKTTPENYQGKTLFAAL